MTLPRYILKVKKEQEENTIKYEVTVTMCLNE